jgi:hypothetical protein
MLLMMLLVVVVAVESKGKENIGKLERKMID